MVSHTQRTTGGMFMSVAEVELICTGTKSAQRVDMGDRVSLAYIHLDS